MKKSSLAGLCLLLTLYSFSQAKDRIQLFGTVTDARNGLPLAGASVILADSRTGTITDSSGHYRLNNISPGHTTVEISFSGYKTLVEHLDITATRQANFILSTSVLENEGVTVTAVANATSIRKAPIAISKVNKTELLSSASSNIIDALSRQPGVSQLSTGPAISKPIIRGLGYNRLVVINDGIRQEGQQWGDEHGIEIDEQSVSRVEIVKGPASLIYGSDALAGVVNIITTSPVPVNSIKGNIFSSYQSNNRQRSLYANLGGNRNGWNWNAWGDMKAAEDYKNRYDGRVFNSRFQEKNYGGYAGYNGRWGYSHLILSNFNQTLGLIEGERDASGQFTKTIAGGTVVPVTADDFGSTDPQVPYQQVHHFKITSDNSFILGKGRITLNLAWQENKRKEFGDPDASAKASLFFNLGTFNYNVIYHVKEYNGWTTSAGLNGMAQSNRNLAEEKLIPEYDLFDIGGFIYLQKSKGAFTFSGGARYDHRDLHSSALYEAGQTKFAALKRHFGNISSSAGFSYSPGSKLVLKANLAQGFRAPSIPELASNGAHEGTNRYEYGSASLQSEKSIQGDAGFEWSSDHVAINGNVFYNSVRNFIFYSRLPSRSGMDSLVEVDGEFIPAFQFDQHNAKLYGAELVLDFHPHPLDWLHWENTVSYVRGQFAKPVAGIRDLPLIPATHWISELKGNFLAEGKIIRNLVVHFDADRTFPQRHPFTAFDTETETPGYTLMNAGVSANIQSGHHTVLSIYLNVTNIGDVEYQSHLSRLKYTDVNLVNGRTGVFNMGRNFSIKLNVPFSF